MNYKMNNNGTTLVEVIVGFILLVVLLTSFVKIIDLSSRLTTAAVDARNNSSDFDKAYLTGYNYPVDVKTGNTTTSKPAFRTSTNWTAIAQGNIKITEWEKNLSNGDFKEYHYDTSSKTYKSFTNSNSNLMSSITLNKTSIIKIENLYDNCMARSAIFRYFTEKTSP